MKRACLFIIAIFVFVVSSHAQTTARAEMVKQLLALESALLKEDKQKVASYFTFPVADESLKLKVEYDGEKELAIAQLDKPAFLKYYGSIISPGLLGLFKHLDLSALKSKNEVTKINVPKGKTDFCQYNYEVNLEGEEVKIVYMLNTRDDIKLGEHDFCPEYAEFWTFEMVKGKLKFKSIEFAG